MPVTTPQINRVSILQKCIVAASKDVRLENLAYGAILSKVRLRKMQLIKAFNEHEVTKEIERGASANSSFLSDGNLFSFIGFHDDGEEELQFNNIRTLLDQDISLNKKPISKTPRRSSVTMQFILKTPSLKDIWAATPYPNPPPGNMVRSGSWVNDIEHRGIGGFEYFLYLFSYNLPPSPKSRSGPGLQTNSTKSHGRMTHPGQSMEPIPYIEALINEFREKVGAKS